MEPNPYTVTRDSSHGESRLPGWGRRHLACPILVGGMITCAAVNVLLLQRQQYALACLALAGCLFCARAARRRRTSIRQFRWTTFLWGCALLILPAAVWSGILDRPIEPPRVVYSVEDAAANSLSFRLLPWAGLFLLMGLVMIAYALLSTESERPTTSNTTRQSTDQQDTL